MHTPLFLTHSARPLRWPAPYPRWN